MHDMALVALAVLQVSMQNLARGIDLVLQHQFDNIHWEMDSCCQPACRSILLRWLKHMATVAGRYLPGVVVYWPNRA